MPEGSASTEPRCAAACAVALVGFGAMAQEVARVLQAGLGAVVRQIVVRPGSTAAAVARASTLALDARVLPAVDLGDDARRWIVVECAGAAAVGEHVVPALRAGASCVVASVGSLCDDGLAGRLQSAAREGGGRLRLVSGAVGGLDALDAATRGALDSVVYTGRKPPRGWRGTPAESVCDLDTLAAPCVVFRGSARDAAAAFPKNANSAAAIGLAGIGLDRTRVELVADPGVDGNVHEIVATGAFGRLEMRLANRALPDNPKTSALAAWSVVRAIDELAAVAPRDAAGPR